MHHDKSLKRLLTAILLFSIVSGCVSQTIPLKPVTMQSNLLKKAMKDPQALYVSCDKKLTLSCRELMLCDVALLPGEHVNSISCGDTSRWQFQTIINQADTMPVTHVLIKPKESDLKTNVIIATNQRLYRMHLVSKAGDRGVEVAAFYNPKSASQDPSPAIINSHYQIKVPYFRRLPNWLPSSIYDDGQSVYIHMPNLNRSSPVFYVQDATNQLKVVNYHVFDHYYLIDQLFAKGVLIQGTGNAQEKVMIRYLGDRS